MAEPIQTVNHLVLEALDRYAAQVCFSVKSARLIQNITYRQFRKWVFRLSGYLQQQAGQGDELLRVAIVARNSPEWMAAYVASLLAGVLVVPIRSSLPLHQAEYILRNTGTNLIIGHERDVALLLGYFQDRLPRLRRALFIRNTDKPILPDMNGNGNNGNGNNGNGNNGNGNNGNGNNGNGNNGDKTHETGENGAGFGNGKHSLGGVETHDLYSILNRPLTAEQAQAVRDAALNLPGHEPAAVFYTPASDGKLRGLVFSLEQGRLTLESMADWFELDEDDLGYTPPHPLSDFAGLHAALHYLVSGVPNTLATGRETSFEELQHYSPTVTLTNPYVFEHIYLKVMEEMGQMPRSSRQVFQWALTVGKDYHAAGLNASPELSESYRRADMTFFSNIRGMLGGRLHRLYSTGAPLSQQWLDFAEAIGLAPLNVYSSSRAGGFPAASPVNERVTGSCGQITPGYQIRIADDGEILVRSRAVALGEWLANGRVRPLVDADGWLHTGDLGRFDSDGNLYLTGHKTAPLILATGRKVNPGPIEEHLTASPFIKHAMIYGEGRRYLSALIVPDFKAIAAIVAESASTESTPTGSMPTEAVPTKPHAVDEDTFPNAAPVAQAAASPTQAASPSPDPQAEHGESDPQLADDGLADDRLADDSLAADSLADSSPDITLRQVAQAQGRLTAQAVSDSEPIGAPHYPASSLGAGSGNATDITAGVIPRDVLARLTKLSTRDLSVKNPAVVDLIEQVVRLVNVNLDDWEQIERFRLIKNLNRNGSKTAKKQTAPAHVETHDREEIAGAYTAEIEAMYPTAMPFAKKQVTQVKVDPEHLRQLVEKEGILDAWMNDAGIEFLLELARQKQIDAPSMVNIAETIAAISQMQNELRPLSTAFLVGNPTRIARYLPESALQLRQYDHIRRMRRIVIGLSKIVDGQVMAFALDKYGFLRGIHRLDVDMDVSGSDLTGTHYRLMANISRRCDSVVFSIPRGGRQVRVFSDGRLAGRYVNGSWLPEGKTSIDQAVIRLAERKEYDLPLLRRLIRCAFRMSELNQGAIFLLGDASTILERSDESEIQNVATIINMPVSSLSDDELIAFAKEDGATVVDTSGELRGCMVLLRPAAATQAQIGPGKGARHSSAAKMSAETDCIAITVSQDGPITVYDGGQRVIAL